jgi:uncharacterized protein
MLKVVLDTNVLVSALLKPDSTPELVLSLILEKQVVLCVSEPIAAEYEEVLRRPKFRGLDRNKVASFLARLKAQARCFAPQSHLDIIETDPEDNKFLECAQEAKADFLITGNTKHFPFQKFHKTRTVSPAEFLAVVAKKLPL